MTATTAVLSLQGKGLKLDTRADIDPWLKDVDPTAIEEIHLGGNTIGVDASTALADFLRATTKLKVRILAVPHAHNTLAHPISSNRWQTLPTSLPDD
jgi:Ran GTPase-activating protein (RanGAP) involved in mRNA processing and transport